MFMNEPVTRRGFVGKASFALGGLAAVSTSAVAVPASSGKPRSFNFSLNAGTILGHKLTLPEQIEVTAKAGYAGFEPWLRDITKFLETGGSLKDLRKRCDDLGLKIVGGIGFTQWIVNDDAVRAKGMEQLKKEIEQLAQLGAPQFAAPPAGMTKPDVKLDLNAAAERYRAILELGKQGGVIPMLEIWGASANISTLAEALYITAKAGHPDACILADIYHIYKGGNPPDCVRQLSPSATRVFHMNDYPATPTRDTIKDSDRIWPGDGIAPIKQILSSLAENSCAPWLSLELFNQEYYKLPALEAAKTGLAKMKAAAALG